MKEITENRQYCKQENCEPSIANCRLLIAQQPLEFRKVIGSVFCENAKRGNSGRMYEGIIVAKVFSTYPLSAPVFSAKYIDRTVIMKVLL